LVAEDTALVGEDGVAALDIYDRPKFAVDAHAV